MFMGCVVTEWQGSLLLADDKDNTLQRVTMNTHTEGRVLNNLYERLITGDWIVFYSEL